MTTGKLSRFWTLVAIFLVAIIVIGGIVTWLRYRPDQPIEISLHRGREWQGSIYISGAVNNPGLYPFTTGDSMEALIQAAGSTASSANLSGVKLYIPRVGEEQESQKVDINRAEAWLLNALPEIGETLAQRIIEYRQKNGPFHDTIELTKVAGIGTATYEQIKDLITVTE